MAQTCGQRKFRQSNRNIRKNNGAATPPFLWGKIMEMITITGGFAGLAALAGMLWNLIKIGTWKGRLEERLEGVMLRIDKADKETASAVMMQNQQNIMLAKLESKFDSFEAKLDLLLNCKHKGGRNGN